MASLLFFPINHPNFIQHATFFQLPPLTKYNLNPQTKQFNFPKGIKCSSTSLSSLADHSHVEETHDQRPLSQIWKQIQGCNDWAGLLDPMNSHLRREIIRYGDFAQACYDSFGSDPHSNDCGSCKYQGSHFFEKLGMADHGYQISRYLYVASNINLTNFYHKLKLSSVWSTDANWMGYIAVCTDEEQVKRLGRRDIVISWRGTVTYLEWIYDLKDILHSPNFTDDPSIKMELGFYDLYTKKEDTCNFCSFSAREQVLAEIKRLVEYYDGEELSITITGHSLGAALAIVTAYDIAELGLNVVINEEQSEQTTNKIPITVYSFAGPRVGNLKVLRVINIHDKIPTVPGIFANEKVRFQKYLEETLCFPWSYAHVGVELALDHTHSPFLKSTNDMGCTHSLEAHLHLLDGYHGKGRRFSLANKRDIALVNKDGNFLKKELGVPPCWRQEENKGMIRDGNGHWVVPELPRVEAHPHDISHHLDKIQKIALRSSQLKRITITE